MLDLLLIGRIIFAIILPLIWGTFENRAWHEAGENWILNHFKTYHVVMFAIFAGTAFTTSSNFWLNLGLFIWAPLSLDVVWWIIRWLDFRRDPVWAEEHYGEPNAWHLQTDWDNWLGLPLVFGTYWWWYVFGALTTVCIVLSIY